MFQTLSISSQDSSMLPSKEIFEDTSSDPSSPPIFIPSSTTDKKIQSPTAYPSKKNSTNLHRCYFTPLPHLLPDIISSYYLPLIPPYLPRDYTFVPPGSRPIRFLSSHTVFTSGLIPIKSPAEDLITVLPTQLYTSIYSLRYSMPHMPYIPISYYT